MKLFGKLISALLVVLMCAGIFVGCGKPANNGGDETTAGAGDGTTSNSVYLDALPEKLDFGGETIRYVCDTRTYNKLTERSLVSEGLNGDIVDTAVYKRNNIITDRFGVKFEIVKIGEDWEVPEFVRQSVLANSDDYDVVAGYQWYCARLAAEGLMLNLKGLPNLDFSREYWSQSVINGMSYKDATYWCTGDLSLRYTGGMYVSFINKTVWENYFPDEDYYEIAENGEWTLDKVNELTAQVYDDLNQNNEKDDGDRLGALLWIGDDVCEGLVFGSDITFSSRDTDGTPYLDYDVEKFVGVCEKLHEFIYNNPGVYDWENDIDSLMFRFAEGDVLCTMTRLYQSEINLRNMKDDFAVLPMPKYDENQTKYTTVLHDGLTLFGIPNTNSRLDMTTTVLEALAAESYRTLTPVYYEMALKIKYVRDEISAKMIDLVRENVVSDFAYYYRIGDMSWFFRKVIDGKTNFASRIAAEQSTWEADLDDLLTNLEKYS